MALLRRFIGGFRGLFRKTRMEQELDAELREFLETAVEQKIQAGLSQEAAIRAARMELGSVEAVKDRVRDVGWESTLESFWRDVRYALRTLRRQPAFTVVALLILTPSIGLITTLFTVFSDTALRPWSGVADVARVIRVYGIAPNLAERVGLSHPEYRYLAEHARAVAGLAAWRNETVRLDDDGDGATRITLTTANFFDVLASNLERGRSFGATDDAPRAPQPVAVISADLWQRRFARDPAIIGRLIRLDGVSFEVIGVASRAFAGSEGSTTSLWVPLGTLALLRPNNPQVAGIERAENCCSHVAGRLAPGFSRDQARSEFELLSNQFRASVGLENQALLVTGTSFLPPRGRTSMLIAAAMMFAALLLVLLLACANLGNLLLARAAARGREISVRLSLGATRRRVVRQLLTESMVLAVIAGTAGLLLATQLAPLLRRLTGSGDLSSVGARLDWVVLAGTFAIASIACLAFGLAPALHATRAPLVEALKAQTTASGRLPLRSVLLGFQVAVTVLFLACAGLFVRGVQQARTLDLGFALDDAAVVVCDWPADAYDNSRKGAFLRDLAAQLGSSEGPPTGLADWEPLEGSWGGAPVRLPGQSQEQAVQVNTMGVSGGYFDVLRIPILWGRNFLPSDTGGRPVIVNETFARRFWPGDNAVGKTFLSRYKDPVEHEVVGVAKDAFTEKVDRVDPTFYRVFGGALDPRLLIQRDDHAARARIEGIVTSLDSRVRVQIRPLAANFDGEVAMSRRTATVTGVLGSLALALAIVGMFGVFAYAVQQRTREFGIRVALGAKPMNLVLLVLSGSTRPVIIGLLLGFLGAIASARMLRHLLFGLSPFDAVTFAAVASVVALAGLAASCVPVRRAVQLDPVQALRNE
jgi:putative ABC transport system permease protein